MKHVIYSCALFFCIGQSLHAASASAAAAAVLKSDADSKLKNASYSRLCVTLGKGSSQKSTLIEAEGRKYPNEEYEKEVACTLAKAQQLLANSSLPFKPDMVTVSFWMHKPEDDTPFAYAHGYCIEGEEDFSRAREIFLSKGVSTSGALGTMQVLSATVSSSAHSGKAAK